MVKNKLFIAIGTLILIVGFVALFPLDVLMNEDVPGKIVFSFSGILLGLLLLLYGFFENSFFKSLATIASSVFLSIIFWYLYFGGEWGDKIVMFWVGVPSGIIAGVLFLILNKYMLSRKLLAVRAVTFLLLIVLLNFLFFKGGDLWSFI